MRYQLKENQGRHILRNDGQRLSVQAGDIVDDAKWRIPDAMKTDFHALDPEPEKERKPGFKIVSSPGGYYDVIHPVTKMAINSKKLRKPEATALMGMTVEEYEAKVAKEAEEAEAAKMKTGDQTGEGDGGQ